MDYSQLPEDVLVKIVEDHMPSFYHLVAFSHVCRSWRIAARQSIIACRPPPCLPGLLLSRSCSDSHEFLAVPNFAAAIAPPPSPRRRLTIRRRLLIPLGFDRDYSNYSGDRCYYLRLYGHPCIASKDGWVLVIELGPSPDPLRIQLLNPVTRETIPLPPFPSPYPEFTVDDVLKAIISSSPDGCSSSVFLVFPLDWDRRDNFMLASCPTAGGEQSSSSTWKFTCLDPSTEPGDAAYSGGKLYMVVSEKTEFHYSAICVLDDNPTTTPTVAALIPFTSAMRSHFNRDEDCGFSFPNTYIHLAHLNGQLLVVFRRHPPYDREHAHPDPVTFYIYRLLRTGGGDADDCWEQVRDLDGHSLFLGSAHSAFCLPASDRDGVQRDCIYFALCFRHGHNSYYVTEMFSNNCGVFSLVDQRLQVFARRPFDKHNYFWFLFTPSDVFSSSAVRDDGHYRLVRRERLRQRKTRQRQYRKAFNHRINYAEVVGNREQPQRQESSNNRHTNVCTTTTTTTASVPLLETEWTTIPIPRKNNHHKRSNEIDVPVYSRRINRFQALDDHDDDHQCINDD